MNTISIRSTAHLREVVLSIVDALKGEVPAGLCLTATDYYNCQSNCDPEDMQLWRWIGEGRARQITFMGIHIRVLSASEV